MKNHCHLCNKQIERDDFYMDYGQGPVCSTCLVGLETPDMGVSTLFMENDSGDLSRYEPSEQVVIEALTAIS